MAYSEPLDGTAAPDEATRLLHVIFGVVGACDRCLPRRVPARYEVWVTVLAIPGDPGLAPYTESSLLCAEHTAEAREPDDPEIFVAMARTLSGGES